MKHTDWIKIECEGQRSWHLNANSITSIQETRTKNGTYHVAVFLHGDEVPIKFAGPAIRADDIIEALPDARVTTIRREGTYVE